MDDLDEVGNHALNRDAASIVLDASCMVTVEISVDGGRRWERVGRVQNNARTDLTRFVRGRYGYLVRLKVKGSPGEALVRFLELRTWGQVAPISIPRLSKGKNILHLDVNDSRNLPTRLLSVLPHLGDRTEVERYEIEMKGNFQPERFNQRLVGQLIVPVRAPPGGLIDWITAGAMFTAYRTRNAHLTANRIEVAEALSGPYRTVYDARGKVPDWNEHWHYAMDVDVDLDEPQPEVFVRYIGDPALNAVRIHAHWIDPRPSNSGIVKVVHEYAISDQRVFREFRLPASGGTYSIECPEDPTNLSLAIEVPHSKSATKEDL
jgi:hypothetical protein